MKLSESILHEADYIDSTPLDNRVKRNTTIKRLRNYANEVAVYENRLKVWADLYMESKADIERLRGIADSEADRIVELEAGLIALAERAERVLEGEGWNLAEYILRKHGALLTDDTP